MSVLRISLFGGIRIVRDDPPGELKLTRAVQALLAYLLLQRHRTHRREVLAGIFWGEQSEERARRCLNTTLWRLRRVLEPEGVRRGTFIEITPLGEVGFNAASDHWLDAAVFEAQAGPLLAQPVGALEHGAAHVLEHALHLYTGDLLDGFYDDWAVRERERLRSLYLDGLTCLMRYHQQRGNLHESIAWGQRLLHHDPLREEIHRELMRLFEASGQRALAVRQYAHCRELLAAELDVPPMEETRALYAAIVPAHERHRPHPTASPLASLRQALQQLAEAAHGVDEAQKQLQRAIQLVERLAERRGHRYAGAVRPVARQRPDHQARLSARH